MTVNKYNYEIKKINLEDQVPDRSDRPSIDIHLLIQGWNPNEDDLEAILGGNEAFTEHAEKCEECSAKIGNILLNSHLKAVDLELHQRLLMDIVDEDIAGLDPDANPQI